MRPNIIRALGLLVALNGAATLAQSPAPAATPTADHITWEKDFDAALQRAKTERKPLFVAFLMDDEPANDEVVKKHYTDAEIIDLSKRFVCLVCCIGNHPGDSGCAKFPGIACADHQAIEKKARARWMVGNEVCVPQHVFCDSNGEVVLRKIYLIPKDSLAKCMAMTLQKTGGDTKGLNPAAMVDKEKLEVDGWIRDLDGNNLELKETALRGLAYADDPRALPAVLRRCEADQDDMIRLAAIGALGKKGNYEAVKPLVAMLKEPKAPILIRVAQSLETIQMPDAAPALLAAAKKERRDRVLGLFLRAAARSQSDSPEIRDLCLRTLKNASSQLEGSVMVALGRLAPNVKIAEAMATPLKSRNQNTRGLAVWVLGAQRTPESKKALEALQREEKTPEVQKLLESAVKRSRGETVEGYDSLFWTFYSEG